MEKQENISSELAEQRQDREIEIIPSNRKGNAVTDMLICQYDCNLLSPMCMLLNNIKATQPQQFKSHIVVPYLK